MTFKKEKTKKGYSYTLLDDFVDELILYSETDLRTKEVDIITTKILEIGLKNGKIATDKGIINYKLTTRKWEDDNENN